MTTISDLRDIRISKLQKIVDLGIDPFPPTGRKTNFNSEITEDYKKYENKEVVLSGRLMSWREHGPLIFGHIQDQSGKIQLYIKKDILNSTSKAEQNIGFDDLRLLDVGDFIEATGIITKTQKGEISIQPKYIRLLSKSLRPLPEKWEGLKDVEERYRKRYLDLISNPESKKVIDARWKITSEIRKFLWEKKFVEVETPVLQTLYGGANARPFTTHFNALGRDFYLRVAPELYLKRLIIGGYEKVFEIAKNFRNEGIDHTHFPEFTMLEWYEAYTDYNKTMDLAEELLKHLAKTLYGSTVINVKDKGIDIGKTWERIPIEDLFKEKLNVEWDSVSDKEVKEIQKKYSVDVRGTWTKGKVLFATFEKEIAPKLENPTWVIDYPSEVSPLSRQHRTKVGRSERFEGYIGGVEVFDGWSEIISGLEQRQRFEAEQKNMREGDKEAMPIDEDFVEALEYGCPPLGGIGFGIDRMVMLLTNTWAIKDVVAFPILKPEN
jgi:lysyl-tRNA synthetase class 2